MHGDHFLGIPGLLQTMNMSGRKEDILLAGPEGFREVMKHLIGACGDVEYNVDIEEASSGEMFVFKEFTVRAFDVVHGIPSLGYVFEENERKGKFDRSKAISLGIVPGPDFSRLQNGETVNGVRPEEIIGPSRKGRRIVYSGDTLKCPRVTEAAKDADVLIHEATYSSKDSRLAEEHMHSTASDAAGTARDANVSLLLITHMSGRYDDHSVLEDECREIFPNTVLAEDMSLFTIR
jgi:ribonuclease Z